MDGGKRMASNWEVILTPFLGATKPKIPDLALRGGGSPGQTHINLKIKSPNTEFYLIDEWRVPD